MEQLKNLVHPIVQGFYYGDDGYYYYDPNYNPYYEGDHQFGWNDFTDGFPNYKEDDLKDADSKHWFEYIYYFRYIFDLVFIAIPWFIFSLATVGWNWYINIDWNRFWAEGNLWLIFNTIFLMAQTWHSWMLAFEIPIYLRAFRATRYFAVINSVLYIWFYLIVVLIWVDQLYVVTDKESYDFMTVYVNMLLGYDMVIHAANIPVCFFIILKEISMEFFQFLNPQAGSENDKISMGMQDEEIVEKDFVYYINPANWFNDMFGAIL